MKLILYKFIHFLKQAILHLVKSLLSGSSDFLFQLIYNDYLLFVLLFFNYCF